jgi:hypothetical protein
MTAPRQHPRWLRQVPNTLSLARLLADACGWPITSTSANKSGDAATEDPGGVRAALGDELDAMIDAGPSPGGAPSTIVDARTGTPEWHVRVHSLRLGHGLALDRVRARRRACRAPLRPRGSRSACAR